VPLICSHEPEENVVAPPQPSMPRASVTEAGAVSAFSSVPARPLSKMKRESGACAKAQALITREKVIRRDQFIRITIGLDLAAGVQGTNDFRHGFNHFRILVSIEIQCERCFLASLVCSSGGI